MQGGESGLRPIERVLRSLTPVIPVQLSLADSGLEERSLVAQKDFLVDSHFPGFALADTQPVVVRVTRNVEIKLNLCRTPPSSWAPALSWWLPA